MFTRDNCPGYSYLRHLNLQFYKDCPGQQEGSAASSPWHQTRISPARCHLDQALGTGQLLWGHGCYPAQLNIQLSNQAQNLIEINNDVLEISRLISTEMFFIVLIFNYEVTRLTMSAAGALIIKYQFLVGTSHQPQTSGRLRSVVVVMSPRCLLPPQDTTVSST